MRSVEIEAVCAALATPGARVAVVGAAGSGRTWTTQQVTLRLRTAGVAVRTVSGSPAESGLAYAGVHQLVLGVLDELDDDFPTGLRHALLAALARVEANPRGAAMLLADLVGMRSADGVLASAHALAIAFRDAGRPFGGAFSAESRPAPAP